MWVMVDSEQAISRRRLRSIMPDAIEGDPDYWYGVVDGFAGSLWNELFVYKSQADRVAKDIDGTVVIVAARILEDADGEYIEPAN